MAKQYTRQEIEEALDDSRLYVHMNHGNSQLCRRNGQTQIWKTRPDDYRVPFKHGFKSFGQVTPLIAFDTYFLIKDKK